ncbi:MAG TPA: O-antigen ligase family protein [Thermoleophilaceae bacterium]|nr:O-antigen ligase family protein [Thermoleophilaceae bacterium]
MAAAGAARRDAIPRASLPAALVAAFSVLLGLAVAAVLPDDAPATGLALAGGAAALAVLALAVASYRTAVALGFALLGVVAVEPAPADGIFAVTIALALVTRRFRLVRVPVVMIVLVAGLVALNVLSFTAAVDDLLAARFFAITLYLVVFALWLAAYTSNASRARTVARAYLLGAVPLAALTSVALFVSFPGSELLLTEDGLRGKGPFKDPNVFGPFFVPLALLLIEELLRPRLLAIGRVAAWVLLITVTAAVLFSYSRAAWLNLAVAMLGMLLILTLRRGGGRRAAVLLAATISLAGMLAITLAVTGSTGFLAHRADFQAYDVQRFGAQASGVQLAEEHPFGLGPGQFEEASPLSAHSLYARALAEQGFAGLAVVLLLVGGTLALAVRNAVKGADTHGIGSAALFGAWCGLLVNSAVVDTLHWRHFWLVAALIWAGAASRRRMGFIPAPATALGPKDQP